MIMAGMERGQALVARLATRAQQLGQAHAETLQRRRRNDSARWRLPSLLWPLFAKDR